MTLQEARRIVQIFHDNQMPSEDDIFMFTEAMSFLIEEEHNPGDAILVLDEKGQKLGYIPEKDNIVFARLMDAGKYLIAKVEEIENKGSFR